MNPEDAIARLRAKAAAVERANRQAEKTVLLAKASVRNNRVQCDSCTVKSVEHVIADLSAKASMVEILSLTAAELHERNPSIYSSCMSPTCRSHYPRPVAFPKLPLTSPQSSPRTPLPHRTSPNPGRLSLSSPRSVCSPHGEISRLSSSCKPSIKTKLLSSSRQYDVTSPRQLDVTSQQPYLTSPRQYHLSAPRQQTPRSCDTGSSRGRSAIRESHKMTQRCNSLDEATNQPHHPLCLQSRDTRFPCSCHCVSSVFPESRTPRAISSKQRVTFSSSPRYFSVAERGFEDMNLVALSPPAWREELAPDLVQLRSQDRISPITIPSIIDDAPVVNDDSCFHSRTPSYRKPDGKTRSSQHRRIALIH